MCENLELFFCAETVKSVFVEQAVEDTAREKLTAPMPRHTMFRCVGAENILH